MEEIILKGLILFVITAFTNTLGTLKTIFVSKKILKPVYVITFIDAIIFTTIMKEITNNENFIYIFIYAIGRVAGVYIGDIIESKLAIGVSEVQLFLSNKEKMKLTADELREAGYSVNNFIAMGVNGEKRYMIETIVARKEFDKYKSILESCGIENPTLKVKSVNKTSGKITPTSS